MDMCYDGALVMPCSYAVMEQNEMMYVEGGGKINTSIVSAVIDVAIAATGFGGISAIGRLTGAGLSKFVKKVWANCGKKACSMLSTALGSAIGTAIGNLGIVAYAFVSATSIGGLVALVLDATDKKMDSTFRW